MKILNFDNLYRLKSQKGRECPQIQINNKKLVLQLQESLDFMRSHILICKTNSFYKNYLVFRKNYIMPSYKKTPTSHKSLYKKIIFLERIETPATQIGYPALI